MHSTIKRASCVSMLLLVVAAMPMPAQTSNPPGIGFAMIGIAPGQTARLNALNLRTADAASPASCSATLQFLDTEGNVLKQGTVNVSPGKAASLDLSPSELQTGAARTEIRAVALFGHAGGANPPGPILQSSVCNSLVPSLEIFDSVTGAASLVLVGYRQLPEQASHAQ